MKNCTNCLRFPTCKFVERNNEFAKKMYSMFEYDLHNNLDKRFYENANSCQYFIHDEFKADDLLEKIETAKYQMNWISDYVEKSTNSDLTVTKLIEITKGYIKKLEQ